MVRWVLSTKFVGSYMDPGEEVSARVAAASKAYYRVKTVMRLDSRFSMRLKLRLYEGVVKPTLVLNLWTVPLKKAQRDCVDRTDRRHLRDLVGKYCSRNVYLETNTVPISVELVERRWTLLGHVLRLPADTDHTYQPPPHYVNCVLKYE